MIGEDDAHDLAASYRDVMALPGSLDILRESLTSGMDEHGEGPGQ